MRKQTLILLLFVGLFNTTAFSQWYSDNSIWYFNKQEQVSFQAHGYTKYTIEKDTLINSISSRMVIVNGETYNGNILNTDTVFVYENNNKVYYWNNTEFKLMYDFNLNVGDTINIEIINNCDSVSPIIIDSVNIVNIDGIDLRKQFISFTGYSSGDSIISNYEILEFVGYEQNFIFAPSCIYSEAFVYTGLRCFSNENFNYKSLWWQEHYDSIACDELINETYINEIDKSGIINIFPNPAKDNLQITINNTKSNKITVFVYDIFGQEVSSTLLFDNKATIDVSHLQSGVYFIKINNKVSKFIKE
jgi:hypothetical protein